MEWYTLAPFTAPPFRTTDNDRYPAFSFTSLNDYLGRALVT
jgi:hypothetical protein